MNCSGCYTDKGSGYCLKCRKQLFDGAKVAATLGFDAPQAANLAAFQQHTKHLSISGVQLKYSLHLDGNRLLLTEENGQYILKPVPPSRQLVALEDVPENEHLTMQIAAQLFQIHTAANGLVAFRDGQPAYITRRFDVRADGSKYQQEDFAQLLNRTSDTHGTAYKYDGSYEEMGALIRNYVAAALPALEQFFRIVVFNYVLSNGDAHLKNFSLIRADTGEYRLTPAYDLMSTVIHTPYESDTALDLYEDSIRSPFYETFGYYGRPDFLELARRLGMLEKRAARILDEFIHKEQQVIAFVDRSRLSPDSKAKYIEHLQDKVRRLVQEG